MQIESQGWSAGFHVIMVTLRALLLDNQSCHRLNIWKKEPQTLHGTQTGRSGPIVSLRNNNVCANVFIWRNLLYVNFSINFHAKQTALQCLCVTGVIEATNHSTERKAENVAAFHH